jgi:Pyruvate/2-oxoglutarate dehydrogenase complex, dehydrogenase (E1) component, eukaryotic type, alpha subunit
MSDPGTTYRTREEVQRMRSTQDPIRGLQRYIEEWGLATEQELKVCTILQYLFLNLPSPRQQIDKAAKAEVDEAVEDAKASPEPLTKDLWTDIYYKGTEPPFMRGREREEVRCFLGSSGRTTSADPCMNSSIIIEPRLRPSMQFRFSYRQFINLYLPGIEAQTFSTSRVGPGRTIFCWQ